MDFAILSVVTPKHKKGRRRQSLTEIHKSAFIMSW